MEKMREKRRKGKGAGVLYWLGRDFCSALFWFAALANALLVIWDSELFYTASRGSVDLIKLLEDAYAMGLAGHLVPVAVSAASVMRFHDELEDGIYRMQLMRMGRLRFVFRKVMGAFLSGALAMAAALALFTAAACAYAVIVRLPVTAKGVWLYTDYDPDIYSRWIDSGMAPVVYLVKCVFLILYAAPWSVLGTSLTVFIKNKRVAVLFPYVLYILLEFFASFVYMKWEIGAFFPWNLQLTAYAAQTPLGGFAYEFCWIGGTVLFSTVLVFAGMERLCKKQG